MTPDPVSRRTVAHWAVAILAAAATGGSLYAGLDARLPRAQTAAVASAVGASVFFVAYGAADGGSGLAYHRTRSLAGRGGDLAVCAAAALAVALLVGTTASAVAGTLVTDGLIVVSSWATAQAAFGRRRPDVDGVADVGPAD